MTLAAFRKKWKGKRCSGYTSGGGQCVDLARYWIKELVGDAYKGLPSVMAAKQMFGAADKNVWKKVRYKPGRVPPAKAVIIFSGGQWGHVAIVRQGSTKRLALTFDQNWSIKQRCTDEGHAYTGSRPVIGWLIPREKAEKPRKSTKTRAKSNATPSRRKAKDDSPKRASKRVAKKPAAKKTAKRKPVKRKPAKRK